MSAKSFLKKLKAISKFPMPDEKASMYLGKLERWRLSEKQWNEAFEKIADTFTDLPALPEIYPFLKAATKGGKLEATTEPVWAMTDRPNGYRYAKDTGLKRSMPASDYEIEQWKQEAVPLEEGRRIYAAAFLASGGLPQRLEEMQRAVTAAPHIEREAADYDDSEMPT